MFNNVHELNTLKFTDPPELTSQEKLVNGKTVIIVEFISNYIVLENQGHQGTLWMCTSVSGVMYKYLRGHIQVSIRISLGLCNPLHHHGPSLLRLSGSSV